MCRKKKKKKKKQCLWWGSNQQLNFGGKSLCLRGSADTLLNSIHSPNSKYLIYSADCLDVGMSGILL